MKAFFIFDVESNGLHGEGFAVAGGVYLENGAVQWEFCFACDPDCATGTTEGIKWVKENIPMIEETHRIPRHIRDAFWQQWEKAKAYGAVAAAECAWPVEANFLQMCVEDDASREFKGPYPLHEIASFMQAAGMDPMTEYPRTESEKPKHHPLADARQSARLLSEALAITSK